MPRNILTVGAIALVMLGAVLGMAVMGAQAMRHLDSLRLSNTDSITWATTQFETDLARFRLVLTQHRLGEADAKLVERRWNSLHPRLGTLKVGAIAGLLKQQDFFKETFAPIEQGMAEMAAAMAQSMPISAKILTVTQRVLMPASSAASWLPPIAKT